MAAARAAVTEAYTALELGAPPEASSGAAAGFGEAQLELLLRTRPAVASFHFGLPSPEQIAAIKEAGIILAATATCVAEARAVEAAGCDFVVAQGFEAGGHRGSHAPTQPDGGVGCMALIPQVCDAVSIPVVAAGGIMDARGVVAAFALGAAAVQMGSAFLRTPEAETDLARRTRIAASSDTDTLATAAVSGRACRMSSSEFTREMNAQAAAHLPFPLQYELTVPLRENGGEAYSAHLYGQAASLAREAPAAEIIQDLLEGTHVLFGRLSNR